MMSKVQVWIICDEEVLLLKVVPERGSAWHPITANVEKGESLLECAKREVLEETGISHKKGEWINLDFSFEYDGRWGHAIEHVFAMVINKKPKEIKIDPSEHTHYQWIKFNNAIQELEFKPQKVALEKVKCILSKI